MICPHCQQEHPDEASFCPISGKPIQSTSHCPNCGEKVEPTWAICAYCGKPTGMRIAAPPPKNQTAYPQSMPQMLSKPVVFGGVGLVVFVILILAFTALGGDKKPPHYGAFMKQGRSLVQIPELELFGLPGESEIDQFATSNEDQPVVLLWSPSTRVEHLSFYSIKERKELRFNVTAKEDGVLELTPAQSLKEGFYCYIQGDPWGVFLPGWCFEVK
jgi:hypothetical protein